VAARRLSGSVAARGQLAWIETLWWLPADAACPPPHVDGARLAFRNSAQVGWPGELPRPPDLRTGNITEGARSMLRGVLGFLPLVLDLAGIFLGLALHCLSLALSLFAQTHDQLLWCSAASALPHADRVASRAAGDAALRWPHLPRQVKLKPSRYHA